MNDWQKRFGAKRREIDRKLLAEFERSIPGPGKPAGGARTFSEANDPAGNRAALEAIAKAFGRPVQ